MLNSAQRPNLTGYPLTTLIDQGFSSFASQATLLRSGAKIKVFNSTLSKSNSNRFGGSLGINFKHKGSGTN